MCILGIKRNYGIHRGPLGIKTNFITYGTTRANCSQLGFSSRVDLRYLDLQKLGVSEEDIKFLLKKEAEFNYRFLNKRWRIYRRYAPKDCVAMCFYVANRIRDHLKLKVQVHYDPIKMYKNDKKWIKGTEHVEARQRYRVGARDKLSDYLTVYEGFGSSYAQRDLTNYRLMPGMCVYTAEGCQKQSGKWRWASRHMRMYIGKGEFRDNVDTNYSKKGYPVWSNTRSLYVVLGVWDPFKNARKGLQW